MSLEPAAQEKVARLDAALEHLDGARRSLRLAAGQLAGARHLSTGDRCLRNVDALNLRIREVEQARARLLAPQTAERPR